MAKHLGNYPVDTGIFSDESGYGSTSDGTSILSKIGISLEPTSNSWLHRKAANERRTLSVLLSTYKNEPRVESTLPFKSVDLARNCYYLSDNYKHIKCDMCPFEISVEEIKRNPDILVNKHTDFTPDCESVVNDTLRKSLNSQQVVSDSVPRAANSSNLQSAGSPSVGISTQPFGNDNALPQLSKAGANASSTAEFVPTQPNSRLPVPVHVKSVDGRLATDTVMVRSSGRTKPETPAYPAMRVNSAPTRTQQQHESNSLLSRELIEVPKPVCRNEDYDTYEGRLRSYIDFPMSSSVTPEELSRAGFYYTHYSDKTKCPYCMGAIYNWEENDTAFGEHSRHYPHCDYLKHFVYTTLSTPVPTYVANQQPTHDNWEESDSVKAVFNIGYPLNMVRNALSEIKSQQKPLCSDTILDIIFEFEKKSKRCLIDFDSIDLESENELNSLEGAIGGLKLNEQNTNLPPRSFTPASDRYSDLYASDENLQNPDSGNFEGDMDSQLPDPVPSHPVVTPLVTQKNQSDSGINTSTENVVLPARKAANALDPANLDPETVKVHEEYQRLQKSNVCNSCHKNPVNILFLPCRHLVTCEDCAENIDECLDCQEEIIGTVKVFLT